MSEEGAASSVVYDYYTKARNYLFDEIIPEVTNRCKQGKTAALILFLLERKAAGFHEVDAEVSIPDMEAFTNASRSDVKRARSWLITQGYIEVLVEGSGLETSTLRLILDPAEIQRVKAAQKDRQNSMVIRPADKPAKIISRPADSSHQTDEHCPKPLHMPRDPGKPEEDKTEMPANPQGEEVPQTVESATEDPHHQPPKSEPETSSRIFQYNSAHEASHIKGVLSEPPSRSSGIVYIPGTQIRTNIEPQATTDQKNPAFGAVCSFVRSHNVKMVDRDYAFAQWAVNTYGAEAVLTKIQIAKMQTERGVKFASPLGWLRSALTSNYQPASVDAKIAKLRENIRRQRKRAERENAEAAIDRQTWQGYRDQNPNAAQNAYAAFMALVKD